MSDDTPPELETVTVEHKKKVKANPELVSDDEAEFNAWMDDVELDGEEAPGAQDDAED